MWKDIDLKLLQAISELREIRDNWDNKNYDETIEERILNTYDELAYILSGEDYDNLYEVKKRMEKIHLYAAEMGVEEDDVILLYDALNDFLIRFDRKTNEIYAKVHQQIFGSVDSMIEMLLLFSKESGGIEIRDVFRHFDEQQIIDYLFDLLNRQKSSEYNVIDSNKYYLIDLLISDMIENNLKIRDKARVILLAKYLISNDHVNEEFSEIISEELLDDKQFIVELQQLLESKENFHDEEYEHFKLVILNRVGEGLSKDKEFLRRMLSPTSLEVYYWADSDIQEEIEFEGQYIDALEQADRMSLKIPKGSYDNYNINPEDEKYPQEEIDEIKRRRREDLQRLKSEISIQVHTSSEIAEGIEPTQSGIDEAYRETTSAEPEKKNEDQNLDEQ